MSGKRNFEFGGKQYFVSKPTSGDYTEADKVHAKVFNESMNMGCMFRKQLDRVLNEREIWTQAMEAEYETLKREVLDAELAIKKGGFKLSEARSMALEMKNKRARMVDLISERTDLDGNTCEGRADNSRYKALVSRCTFNEDGSRVYKSYDEYVESENTELAHLAATEFYYLSSGQKSEIVTAEDSFLKEFNFVDNEGRLIDKEGRLISVDGKHINEEGRYIKWTSDKDFIYVDFDGNQIDENEEYVVESKPFLDDDGQEISTKEAKKKKAPAKKVKEKA